MPEEARSDLPKLRAFNPEQEPLRDPEHRRSRHVGTVREVIERYIAHAESRGIFAAKTLAERKYVLNLFADYLGGRRVDECCPDDLAEWIDANKTWKSPSTKRHKCQQVQACFNWAATAKRIPNPFKGVVYEEGDRRDNTPDDALLKVMRLTDRPFQQFLCFMRFTGARPGETREATWEEIDWENDVILRQKHKTNRAGKKTKKPRAIPLTREALIILRCIRRRHQYATGEIFRNLKGTPWTKEALDNKWSRLRTRAGLPKTLTLHGIRHQCGTVAVKQPGANIKLVSLGLGHASVSTTEKYYLHLDREFDAIRREMGRAKMNGKPKPPG